MVALLVRKLLRDFRRSAMTYLICMLIVGMGLCGYSVLSIAADALAQSMAYFYQITSFCDAFADVQEAPAGVARRLEQIEGIERAEARLVETIRVEGLGVEDVELLLSSVQEGGMNVPLLSRGTFPRKGETELAVGDGFFEAHQLKAGGQITLVFAGRRVPLTVTGSGITPANAYMIKSLAEMMPNLAAYDAGFIDYTTFSRLIGKSGMANSFVLKLQDGYTVDDIKEEVEQLLKPYGGRTVAERKKDISVNLLEQEIEQISKISTAIPFLFLGVAAIILYITLHRLIEQQRTQAGTLMALGLSGRAIRVHYMSYGAAVGLFGGLLGGILGYLYARPMVAFYRAFFKLPDIATNFSFRYLFLGLLMSVPFCSVVGWLCSRSLGKLAPAEALRPAAPKAARISLLEKIPGFTRLLTVPGLMAVRGLARNRRRTALSVFGIACAYMITATLVSMNSLIDVFMFDYYEQTQQQDITVHFSQPVAVGDAMRAIRDQSVQRAEGILDIPVTLRGAAGTVDCTIQGLPEDSQLTALYGGSGQRVSVQEDGIVLSRFMAMTLGAQVGGTIEAELAYPVRRTELLRITGIAEQYFGTTAYMSRQAAGRLADYGDACTAVLIKAPPDAQTRIRARLENASAVSGVESRIQHVDNMRGMMGLVSSMMGSMASMGVAVGLAVIYTGSLISFEELKREVSTMMMLGLDSKQCLDVISVGQWIVTAGGILLGMPMTVWASKMISSTMASDLFVIPDFVDSASLLLSVLLTIAAVLISSWLMLRKLRKLTPAELLRERE